MFGHQWVLAARKPAFLIFSSVFSVPLLFNCIDAGQAGLTSTNFSTLFRSRSTSTEPKIL